MGKLVLDKKDKGVDRCVRKSCLTVDSWLHCG